jgi:ribosomal protein S21
MIQVKKKEKESSDALVRRFTRRVQQSALLASARSSRFHRKPLSKKKRREKALYNEKIRAKISKLKKLGKFNEETLKDLKRKMD